MLDFLSIVIHATLIALLYNMILGMAGYLLCRAILGRGWAGRFTSGLAPFVLCLALGQAVLGALWQILAVFGLFRIIPVSLVLGAIVIGFCIVARGVIAWTPSVCRLNRVILQVPAYGWAMLVVLAIVIATTWAKSFGWPDGDAMAFYLAQPKLIAYTGAFTPIADYESFSEIGLYTEMHSAVMYLFGGEVAARAWLWQAGILLVLAMMALCAEIGLSSGTCILASAVVLTSTAIIFVMTDGKTDHVGTAWAMASFLVALTIEWRSPWRSTFLAALLAVLACLAKLSFLVGLPVVLIVVVIDRLLVTRPNRRTKPLLTRLVALSGVAGGAAVLAWASLAIKNFVIYGEPMAPFFYLGGGSGHMLNQVWFSPENTHWILWSYPIALTLGKYPMQHGNVSPLLLAFAPMLLLAWRNGFKPSRSAVTLAVAGLVSVGLWMLLRPSVLAPRYILPMILCVVPLLAGGADYWLSQKVSRFAVVLIVLAMVAHTAYAGLRFNQDWPRTRLYATGQKPEALQVAGARLASDAYPGARFLVATYYKSFLDPDVLTRMIGTKEKARLEHPQPASPAEMWKRLYQNGVTDIMIYRPTHPTLLGQQPLVGEAPEWLDVREENFGPIVSVYRLRPRTGAPPPGQSGNVERRSTES